MNKLINFFNIAECKKAIFSTPEDEICILCSSWSINKPNYDDPEDYFYDWDELENELNCMLYHSDYDDLICDPHGIYDY